MSIYESKETYNKYMREYHMKRYYEMRLGAIRKLGGKCVKCGIEDISKLELDHIDKFKKEIEISRMLDVSKDRFFKELLKCQVLCHDCHMDKSVLERGQKRSKDNHGSMSCYQHQKCRCRLCKDVMRDWIRKYRLTHKRNA